MAKGRESKKEKNEFLLYAKEIINIKEKRVIFQKLEILEAYLIAVLIIESIAKRPIAGILMSKQLC